MLKINSCILIFSDYVNWPFLLRHPNHMLNSEIPIQQELHNKGMTRRIPGKISAFSHLYGTITKIPMAHLK